MRLTTPNRVNNVDVGEMTTYRVLDKYTEDYDEVTVWSMRIVEPVEYMYRPHERTAVTIGYLSVVAWLFVGSIVFLEAVWRIYLRLGAMPERG